MCINRLIAFEVQQRFIDTLQIHPGNIHLAHGFEYQRCRYHIQRAHRNFQPLSQKCTDIA